MKAAVYYQPGGPEVFRYEDVRDPELTRTGRFSHGRPFTDPEATGRY